MGYIRFKLSDETEEILDNVCKKLGMKKAEISRMAVMEYLKSLSVVSAKVKETNINESNQRKEDVGE